MRGCSISGMSPAGRRGQLHPAVGAGIVVVCVLGLGWWLMRPGSDPGAALGRKVAERFLEQIREGHPDAAWDSTTAEFKSAQGKEAFLRTVRPLKYLRQPLEFVSNQTVNIGNSTRSEFAFRAATGETVRIVIGREQNDWKVDRWVH